jgi:plastocyanin
MKRWKTGVVVGAVAAGMLMGGTGVAATKRVKAKPNDTWRKIHTYIGKGDTVKWKNPTSTQHDVTFYRGSKFSKQLPPGGTVKKRFKKKKTMLYRCVVHSGIVDGRCQGMCGFVHVL